MWRVSSFKVFCLLLCCHFSSFVTLLIRLLLDLPTTLNSQNMFCKFASIVVQDILLPNLVWKAGRSVLLSLIT